MDQPPGTTVLFALGTQVWINRQLAMMLNAFVVDWVMDKGTMVSSFSAMVGAIILGYPIVKLSLKDIRKGILSINELVGIAVLASFATGDYKTAGLVAFFMLLGEIIETRTAAGARASIESLIKLTPTKARKIVGKAEQEVWVLATSGSLQLNCWVELFQFDPCVGGGELPIDLHDRRVPVTLPCCDLSV